jgi:hypothetical protein
MNMAIWWAMDPYFELMVEVPLLMGYTNNKCRLLSLAPYVAVNQKIFNGMEKSTGSSSFHISTDFIGPNYDSTD